MNTINRGYFNNQAVQVLNYVDYDANGNPIGMKESQTDPTSSNFGTVREPRRGGCYKGDGAAYVNCGTLNGFSFHNRNTVRLDLIFTYVNSKTNQTLCGKSKAAVGDDRWGLVIDSSTSVSLVNNSVGIILTTSLVNNTTYKLVLEHSKQPLLTKLSLYNSNDVLITSNTSGGTFTDSSAIVFLIAAYNNSAGLGTPFSGYYLGDTRIFNIKLVSDGSTICQYKCDENYGTTCYDSSGNGYHGSIINAITTTPETNPNSIHQYQDIYSWHNDIGYNVSGSTFIPRNESVILPPFKDVLGNDLQFIGKVPGKAKFVQSNCFQGDGIGHVIVGNIPSLDLQDFSIKFTCNNTTITNTGSITQRILSLQCDIANLCGVYVQQRYDARIELYLRLSNSTWGFLRDTTSTTNLDRSILVSYEIRKYGTNLKIFANDIEVATTQLAVATIQYGAVNRKTAIGSGMSNGSGGLSITGKMFDVVIKQLDSSGNVVSMLGDWPLCEEIINPTQHRYLDVSGNGYHATLTNGTVGNVGFQDNFHYLQKGHETIQFNGNIALNSTIYSAVIITNLTFLSIGESISFEIKPLVRSGGDQILWGSSQTKYIAITSSGKLNLNLSTQVLSINSLTYDSWNNVSINRTGSLTYTVSINASSENITHSVDISNTEVWPNIGSRPYTSSYGAYSLYGFMRNLTIGNRLNISDIDSSLDSTGTYYVSNLNISTLKFPLSLNNTALISGENVIQQNNKSFLSSGCRLRQYQQPSLIQSDQSTKFWYDVNHVPYEVEWNKLISVNPISEKIFVGNKDPKRISPISTHVNALTSKQRLTERIVRNVVDVVSPSSFQFIVSVTSVDPTYAYTTIAGYLTNGIFEWGDNTTTSVNTSSAQTFTKTYSSAGTYVVKFTGTLGSFKPFQTSAANATKVLRVLNWGQCSLRLLQFNGCSNLTTIPNGPITGLDQVNSITLNSLFDACPKLAIEIPEDLLYYAKNATSLTSIFFGCSSIIGNIPENLFRYCPDLTTVVGAFQGCSGLTGQIPEDLLKYSTKLTSVAQLFSLCSSLSGNIPVNLFRYNTTISNFSTTFNGCSNLTGSIPTDLFRYAVLATTFGVCFNNCSKLTGSIPADLFRYNTSVTSFAGTFGGCTLLSGNIPADLFRYNTALTTVYDGSAVGLFANCIGLTGNLPASLLQYNTALTSTQSMFIGCTGISGAIPTDFIRYNTSITSTQSMFQNCIGLTSIPIDFLRYQGTTLTNVSSLFNGCTGITSIPSGMFDYNTNITTVASTFNNTRIITIPVDIFKYNTKITSVANTFSNIPTLTSITPNIFDTNVLITDMSNVFNSCTNINLISIPTDLFRYNTEVTTFAGCFANFGNGKTLTIPTDLFRYNTKVTSFVSTFSSTKLLSIPSTIFYYNTKVTSFASTFSQSLYGSTAIPSNLFDTNILVTSFDSCFRYTQSNTSIPADLFRYNTLVTVFAYCFDSASTMTAGIPADLFRYNTEVTNFLGVFQNSSLHISITIPEDLFYYNSKVVTYTGALNGSRNVILPTRMFNIVNLGKVTSWQNFMYVTQTAYSPIGTIQKIWSTTDTPPGDVTYTVAPIVTDAFNNCTAISNYTSEIPTTWK